jgi:psp operon transcriptional activator
MALELGWDEIPNFSADAVATLEHHSWPGNIRELKNVVERAVYRSDATTISEIDFDPFHSPFARTKAIEAEKPAQDDRAAGTDLSELLQAPLQEAIWQLKVTRMQSALQKAKYNQKEAARILGLTYHQFRGLYRRYQATLSKTASS